MPVPEDPTEDSQHAEAAVKPIDHLMLPRLPTPVRALEPIYESPGVGDVISR